MPFTDNDIQSTAILGRYGYGLGAYPGPADVEGFNALEAQQREAKRKADLEAARQATLAALPPEYRAKLQTTAPTVPIAPATTQSHVAQPMLETGFPELSGDYNYPNTFVGRNKVETPDPHEATPKPPSSIQFSHSGEPLKEYNPEQGDNGQHGGYMPSQTNWDNVANPMAFEAYREIPEIAARQANISRFNALARDPFAEERMKALTDLGLYSGKRDIDRKVEEDRQRDYAAAVSALDAEAEERLSRLHSSPGYLGADKATRDQLDSRILGAMENKKAALNAGTQFGERFQMKANPMAGFGS